MFRWHTRAPTLPLPRQWHEVTFLLMGQLANYTPSINQSMEPGGQVKGYQLGLLLLGKHVITQSTPPPPPLTLNCMRNVTLNDDRDDKHAKWNLIGTAKVGMSNSSIECIARAHHMTTMPTHACASTLPPGTYSYTHTHSLAQHLLVLLHHRGLHEITRYTSLHCNRKISFLKNERKMNKKLCLLKR